MLLLIGDVPVEIEEVKEGNREQLSTKEDRLHVDERITSLLVKVLLSADQKLLEIISSFLNLMAAFQELPDVLQELAAQLGRE